MSDVRESTLRKASDQLYWDSRIDCADIKVDATDDVITLSGSVPDYPMITLAERDVLSLPDVKGVHNKLTVKPQKKKARYSDSQIKSNIENALSYNSNFDSTDIRVSVADGKVVLSGSTDAYWKKILIEEVVSGISEVSDLSNQLTVVPTRKQSDAAIAEAIIAALNRNKWIAPHRIDVVVNNGVVTLSGTVMNWAARRGAHDIAAYTPGVIDIQDNLVYE